MKIDLRGIAMVIGATALLVAAFRIGGRAEAVHAAATPDATTQATYDIDTPGREGFELTSHQCGGTRTCAFVLKTVPSGHKIVITHVSCNYSTLNDDGPTSARLYTVVNNQEDRIESLPVSRMASQSGLWVTNVNTQLVFDAGTQIKFGFDLESGDQFFVPVVCNTVGYFVKT